MTESNAKLIF